MPFSFIFIMDIIGTIAFAVSGALIAISKEMDIFGVNILALTTATGGGIIRDLLIGEIPPIMFQNPIYVLIAVITANIVFLILYFNKRKVSSTFIRFYETILFWFDTLGLAAFTVDGVSAGFNSGVKTSLFLVSFLGVLTGIGGGIMRDVMAREMPSVFVKKVYACASIAGAVAVGILWKKAGPDQAMLIGFVLIIVIRCLAAHFRWDLLRIRQNKK